MVELGYDDNRMPLTIIDLPGRVFECCYNIIIVLVLVVMKVGYIYIIPLCNDDVCICR